MKTTVSGHNQTREKLKRTIAFFIVVVFIFGTAYVPVDVYASETPVEGTVTETQPQPGGTEADNSNEQPTELQDSEPQDSDEDANSSQESEINTNEAKAEEGSETDMENLLINADNNGIEYDGFIYKIEEDTTKNEINQMEEKIENLDGDEEVEEITKDECYVADSLETIEAVSDAENIQYIEPNYEVESVATPNDPYYSSNGWSLRNINVQDVWDWKEFGSGATVAILDTGKPKHVDINSSKYVNSVNFTNTSSVMDSYGHGTSVAGVIGAEYNNAKGFTGAMPKAKIMPIKVLGNDGQGYVSDVVEGIEYATSKGADVINMSLGCTGGTQSLKNACEKATAQGVILVAAAGNEAQKRSESGDYNPIIYPAYYDCVISVAAVDRSGKRSSFSTYNNKVTVAAPGENIRVLRGTSSYKLGSGTSFASPYVASLAALAKSIKPSINSDEFISILKKSSIDVASAGYDKYTGYGIVDFSRVYTRMTGRTVPMKVYLSTSSYTYNGSRKTPSVIVKRGSKTLVANRDYTVSYPEGRQDIGTYKIKVTAVSASSNTLSLASEDTSRPAEEKTVNFKITSPLVKGIKKPKKGHKKLTVRWEAMSSGQKSAYKNQITGYQVRVSRHSNFSGAKYAAISGYTQTRITVKGLKKKKRYYVQYRSYKRVGTAIYYSKWSARKSAKTK